MEKTQEKENIENQEEVKKEEASKNEHKNPFLKFLEILILLFLMLFAICFPNTFFNVDEVIVNILIGISVTTLILCLLKKRKWGWFFAHTTLSGLLIIGYYLTEYIFDGKPIIYLYPTEQTEVTVKLGNPQKLTHTYPKYKDKWQVIAQPNGDLTDTQTNRSLYALYWEGINYNKPQTKEGFIVKGEDTISFLEEKLAILGLNEREANEFIIYWLPRLENSPYNFVYFKTIAEQDKNMPLYISPKPDTVIRVMMAFKNLKKPIEVTEQVLPPTPQRNGFTVVEWGGTDLTTGIVK